jgi:uncharacterized protein YqhQ
MLQHVGMIYLKDMAENVKNGKLDFGQLLGNVSSNLPTFLGNVSCQTIDINTKFLESIIRINVIFIYHYMFFGQISGMSHMCQLT